MLHLSVQKGTSRLFMNDIPAIQVNNLSKSYTIKHNQSSNNKTLKDDFANILKDREMAVSPTKNSGH